MHVTRSMTIRLPALMVARIRAFAASLRCSHSAATRIALSRGLKAYEDEAPDGPRIGEFLDKEKSDPKPFVYFICDEETGAIKIGFCLGDPGRRLRTLQTSSVGKLKLLLAIPGGQKKEQAMHRRFASIRIRGEWFQGHETLLQFIKAEKNRHEEKRQSLHRR